MRRLWPALLALGMAGAQTHSGHSMAGMGSGGLVSGGMVADMRAMGGRMVAELTSLRGRAFDLRFAQRMSDHHQMAIDMARQALKSGKEARVRKAAQTVIADQQKEIALMAGWIKSWSGQAYTPKSMPMTLDEANADRAFLEAMLPHHEGAVAMAKLAATRSSNAAVKTLASQVIRAQTAEINRYTAWLKAMK